MGLLDFKKPKYHHKNPAIRLRAIAEIDPADSETLAELIVNDQDREVRFAAIERLTDPATLDRLAGVVAAEERPAVVARKEQLLYDLVINETDPDPGLKNLRKISSPELLAGIAVNHNLPALRREAISGIDDEQVLADVLEQNCGKEPARAAIIKITNEELLLRLSESAASKTARQLAAAKLSEIELRKTAPDREEIIRQSLAKLAAEATELLDPLDIDAAAKRIAAIKEEWLTLDPDSSSPDYPAFHQTCTAFAGNLQEIEERRAKEREKAAGYEKLQAGLEEICTTIERLTGAVSPEAEAEKEQAVSTWHSLLNGTSGKTAVSAAMSKRFTAACLAFANTRPKIRHEKELVEAIEQNCLKIKELTARGELKKAGSCLTETEQKLATAKFKYFSGAESRKLVAETAADLTRAAREVSDRNLKRRREICTELEKLAGEINNRTERQLLDLRQSWQKLPTLKGPEAEELEERFRNGLADLTGKLQTFQEEQDWQLWANLTLKEKLTARIEALAQEEDLAAVFETVKAIQAEWKKIGPVPRKKSQPLWDRFHTACTHHFKRTEPYLAERQAERAEAMDRRREIVARTGELAESDEWRKTSEILKGLQNEWRALGPDPRREERELYKQFRQECDRFYERRNDNYRDRKQEQRQHLIGKEKLCEEAEKLAAAPQPDYSKKFRDLQAEWKKIGPVPKEQAEKVWHRFRAACDRYFAWLDEERQANLVLKEDLCRQAEQLVAATGEERRQKEIAAQLTELQRRWKEIGPVPRAKSEEIWQQFHKTCDSFFKLRHQRIEKEQEERRLNQIRKEELLAQAEELAGGRETDKKATARLQELQKDWAGTEAAPREADKELNERFKSLCDAFFNGRRQYFAELKTQQLENRKQKESLCLRLENILGAAHESGGAKSRNKGLSLAEELKQAMEDNFMLAGRRDDKKAVHEEVQRIEQNWRKIGPIPYDQVKPLATRFKKALDQYYRSRR
jgi:hypothetical protein